MPIEEKRTFAIHNYDEHPRLGGLTALPWKDVMAVPADRVTVQSATRVNGTGVYAQVDVLDPEDPSQDVLTILIEDWVDHGGPNEGLEVTRVTLKLAIDDPLTAEQEAQRRAEREESVRTTLDYWLHDDLPGGSNTVRQFPRVVAKVVFPAGATGWEGGAVKEVRLDNFDVLDLPASAEPRPGDGEKRLQLDRVSIANPPWSETPHQEFRLYKKPWTFVTGGRGPVRMFVTMRSPEFEYKFADRAGNETTYKCHLYRVLSVYRHGNFLVEDLWVKGATGAEAPIRLAFAPHFFLKMHMHHSRIITRVPTIPDWFAIGTYDAPQPGYGFAATAPVRRIDNPPGDYPTKGQEHAAFGWQLDYGYSIRCLHLLRGWSRPWEVSDETGRAWFRLMFKPLRAALVR